MSLEISGRLYAKFDTQQVSEKFKKREFVLETSEEINGNTYNNYAKFQLVQNKCEILDRFREGESIKVNFNIKGNKWERDGKTNYITNLDAWRIESAGGQQSQPQQAAPQQQGQAWTAPPAQNFNPSPETVDDLPF